jgi:NAD(P)-dependent dehydrogenase (short-subunit alcohol dehydrogenase family)
MLWMRRNVPAYAADGIRLNTVAPGYTQTPMTEIIQRDPANTKMLQDFAASIPVGGKAAQPEEIAYAINFLLSPRASFVCGVLLFVDGGQDTVLRPNLEAF